MNPEKRELPQKKPISELAKYGYRPREILGSPDEILRRNWRWMAGIGVASVSFLVMAVCKGA